MSLISKIGIEGLSRLFDSIGNAIDLNVTTEAERIELRLEAERLRTELAEQILKAEMDMMSRRASIIESEAKGESWLQRSWRPITALTFLCLIVLHHLGLLDIAITDQMWDLLQVMIGGYVISRGIEKAAPAVARAASPSTRTE
jgi:hypothetical protein